MSSVPTQQALRHLDRAFRNCCAGRARYPDFHQPHGKQAAEYSTSAFRWDAATQTLPLAKMDAPLPIRWSRPVPEGAQPSTVTVSRDPAGRYFVRILLEVEIALLPPVDAQVGWDLGRMTWWCSLRVRRRAPPASSTETPSGWRRRSAALPSSGLAPRIVTKNRDQARRKVAGIHARSADRRRDRRAFLHQLGTRILREHQTLCVASLRVKAMVRHPTLAPAISDVGWGELVRQLTDKAAWDGRDLVAVDTW